MNKNIVKEFKYMIPVFILIICTSIGLDALKPEIVPVNFTIEGVAGDMVKKSTLPYHIPVIELIIYAIATFIQFYFIEKNKDIAKFIFNTKIVLILFVGLLVPFAIYLYSLKYLLNLWNLIGPALGLLAFYLFFSMIFAGILDTRKKSKVCTQPIMSSKKKKKRR